MERRASAQANSLLRMARKERGWTQKDVADRIGAPSPLNVTRWERGTTLPSSYYVERLCQLFEKTPRELGLVRAEEISHDSLPDTNASAPAPVGSPWNVPYRRNLFFTGREDLLRHLYEQLNRDARVSLTQSYAFSGLGGIGKTQLALEYAYRYRHDYQAVLWIRAESRETLIADCVALIQLLGLRELDAREQQQAVQAVRDWMVQHEDWLLILDNADDLSLVTDLLPGGGKGHVLLTTRAAATGTLATSIPVEQMDLDEGILFLLRRAKLLAPGAPPSALPAQTIHDAQAIVQIMGGLPLALEQAGAYIEESECSLAEYLELYQHSRAQLLSRRGTVPADYPHTVSSTWSLSFQQVEQRNPAAAELLQLCALLNPDAIAEELISAGAAHLGPALGLVAADPFLLKEALQVLRAFSLIRRNPETRTLSLHRLVQVVVQDGMDERTRQAWIERAARMLLTAFPEPTFENFQQWPRCQELLPHIQVCADFVERYGLLALDAAHLLKFAGIYLVRRQSNNDLAERLMRLALPIYEHHDYHDQPALAELLNHLGTISWQKGQYEQALELYQCSLGVRQRVLGAEHPDTAASYNNLAIVFWNLARYEQAEAMYQQALGIYERILGPDHLRVAELLTNLGALCLSQDRPEEAESFHQRALTIRERLLEPQHPHIAQSYYNLGAVYTCQHRYDQAEPLILRALTMREQMLGAEHVTVGQTLHNLAELYRRQGRMNEAEAAYQRALLIREKQEGPDHPDVALTLRGLASLYAAQERKEEAGALYQRALAIHEQALGAEHPETIETSKGYTDLLRSMNQTQP